ncbi:MAG: hypothetical protein OJF49_004559 [Ktedonobacterales bacterium]|nr:MAG: hypothetical protein OJF49_004559 [Ktedonobacterales bacterium]
MPDGAPGRIEGSRRAALLAAEDDLTTTILPRLAVAGAEMSRVAAMRAIEIYDEKKDLVVGYRPVVLPRDIRDLSFFIMETWADLVVIDPLSAYLDPNVNTWRDSDVRAALMPLAQAAKERNTAILCMRHLNKSSGANALYRGSGSIGIIGLARSGLLVAKSPDDPEHERILASTKSNLGPPMPSLRYRVTLRAMIPTPRQCGLNGLAPARIPRPRCSAKPAAPRRLKPRWWMRQWSSCARRSAVGHVPCWRWSMRRVSNPSTPARSNVHVRGCACARLARDLAPAGAGCGHCPLLHRNRQPHHKKTWQRQRRSLHPKHRSHRSHRSHRCHRRLSSGIGVSMAPLAWTCTASRV